MSSVAVAKTGRAAQPRVYHCQMPQTANSDQLGMSAFRLISQRRCLLETGMGKGSAQSTAGGGRASGKDVIRHLH